MSYSDMEYLTGKIEKYVAQLKDGHKVGHALRRLEQMNMTVELMAKTGVGKVVNRISRDDPEWGELALSIVTKWKETARNDQSDPKQRSASPPPVERIRIKREVKEEEQGGGYPGESQSSSGTDRKRKVKEEEATSDYPGDDRREKKKSKPAPAPANAFMAALASGDSVKNSKPKKLKSFDLALDIDPNYRPMPTLAVGSKQQQGGAKDDKPFNPEQMFRPRNGLTKIYAGRSKVAHLTEVPRLFDICIRLLQNHINDIDCLGSIPYHVIKPVLDKCTWSQLSDIEKKNPYLEEDTDELWEKLVAKHHANKPTKKHESWKDMFMRCEAEADNRLRMLSERISLHGSAAQDKIRKAVAITDVKMPRGARRRQSGMPAGCAAVIDMPSALQVSKARKEIFENGSKAALSSLPGTVQNRNSTLGSSSHRSKPPANSIQSGPKKGLLMAKTLKMLGKKRL
ncbi:hypothetical protein PFISCL1PPCAC_22958 [Pristionchus fissidentatus]|uniref:TFIIS N-terminal domain-containing protein n=1 Tax=Pristionchus fissidentatus TaxID=1538716 RepID=A0AAV5WI81_9BILA|nr:hypothetical protein PFISCL1PPCAC_22958 [Pristionchus fissidentatus]